MSVLESSWKHSGTRTRPNKEDLDKLVEDTAFEFKVWSRMASQGPLTLYLLAGPPRRLAWPSHPQWTKKKPTRELLEKRRALEHVSRKRSKNHWQDQSSIRRDEKIHVAHYKNYNYKHKRLWPQAAERSKVTGAAKIRHVQVTVQIRRKIK